MSEQNTEIKQFDSIILLRDHLLSNLLGEDIDAILYWAGKDLARNHAVETELEVLRLFEQYSFGMLTQIEEKKNRKIYRLSGEVIEQRLENDQFPSFSLETGYLSQQLQRLNNIYSEGIYEIKPKKKEVLLTIQMDPKEPLPIDQN